VRDSDSVLSYYERILPFYEKECVERAHLAFWREAVRAVAAGRVLEIGSGLGRITAALGLETRTVGIDISMEMLGRARASRSPRSRALFVAADMRALPFRGVFDLVVAPNDPFSHLTVLADRRRALVEAAGSLSPRGRFMLDGLYLPKRRARRIRRPVAYKGGTLSITESWVPIDGRDLWRAKYAYRDRPRRGRERRLEASFLARSWNARVRSFLRSCGLTAAQIWGGFDLSPLTADSHRVLLIAGKTRSAPTTTVSRRRKSSP
jgi:SAM-dependent methyltransferase